jgi:hypothetical protein
MFLIVLVGNVVVKNLIPYFLGFLAVLSFIHMSVREIQLKLRNLFTHNAVTN